MILRTVLLVDDDKVFSDAVKTYLEERNYRVIHCAGIEDAFLTIGKEAFDVAICDVWMRCGGTSEGGIMLARAVADASSTCLIIVVSRYVTKKFVAQYDPGGRYRFIDKAGDFNKKLIQEIEQGLRPRLIYVCMSSDEEVFHEVYRLGIEAVATELGLSCVRPERIHDTKDIEALMKWAIVVIADVTRSGGELLYDLGFARASGKDIVLLTRDPDGVPEKLRDLRCLRYKTDSIAELRQALRTELEQIYSRD